MKTKKIQGIVGGYLEHITAAAAKVSDGFEEEVIHNLRVNVKRLRAFLRCYWLFKGRAKPPLPKVLRSLYKAAGVIRDLQLMLKSSESLPEVYRVAVEQQLAAAKDEWGATYDAKKLDKKLKKLRGCDYKPLPSFMPAEFIKNRLELVDEIRAAGMSDDEDLHTVRKQVKDIIYVARLVNERWSKACTAIQHLPLQKFEELADLIGAFNDSRQAKRLLGDIKPNGVAAADVAARRKVVVHINRGLARQRLAAEAALAELTADELQ